VSDRLGVEVRLPSEWEWQWAAQGKDGREFPWGNEFSERKCNMLDSDTGNKTSAVDEYPTGASAFGVVDMAGNVWEWCLNTYSPPFSISVSGDSHREARGGCFGSVEGWLTTAYRGFGYHTAPDYRGEDVGFRVTWFE
jgi:formylglycine-generating enzyme required for sulfatase activity